MNLPAALVSLIYAAGFVGLVWDRIPEDLLKGAVCFYALTIALMLWSACRRLGSIRSLRSSQRIAVLGAVLFVISDSIIGIDKFRAPVPSAKLAIMVTYYSAQYCLARSVNGSTPVPVGEMKAKDASKSNSDADAAPASTVKDKDQ